MRKRFTKVQASLLARKMRVNFSYDGFTLAAFCDGLNVELEHQDVTGGDPELTAMIALAHLRERPDYYDLLPLATAAGRATALETATRRVGDARRSRSRPRSSSAATRAPAARELPRRSTTPRGACPRPPGRPLRPRGRPRRRRYPPSARPRPSQARTPGARRQKRIDRAGGQAARSARDHDR